MSQPATASAPAIGSAPAISIVTPVYRPQPAHLRDCLASVAAQTCRDFEHVLVDDASGDPAVTALLDLAAAADPRVRVLRRAVNGGIAAATNDALAAARGAWVAFLDQDDRLAPTALAAVLAAVAGQPGAELAYTDRVTVAGPDGAEVVVEEFRKPDWSPERLRGSMYLAHLLVVARAAGEEVGWLRAGFDGAQDHDLALRVAERGAPVVHVPEVLYRWRAHAGSTAADAAAKPYAVAAGVRAVQEHCDRIGLRADVEPARLPGRYRLVRHPAPGSTASIVIPTRGSIGPAFGTDRRFVTEAVASIVRHEYETDYELVLVVDTDVDTGYLDEVRALAGDRLVVVPYRPPFNFSAKVNAGALRARGDVLVFLNDDVEVISPRWLDQLTALAQQPDVGAAGALLVFDDGRIQHAAHRYIGGNPTHAAYESGDREGYVGELVIDREVSGVTAACLATRRAVWWEVGGFTQTLPANFNDVDFCCKVCEAGYRIVAAADAQLWHYESRTRERRVRRWELRALRDRWDHRLRVDRYAPVGDA